MKIVNAKEMARIEKMAYDGGASEEVFMNQAGLGVAEIVQHIIACYHIKPKITLLCGSGNNAGDAYVAGRLLKEGGFEVQALAFTAFEKSSGLCQLQSKRFINTGGVIKYIQEASLISFNDSELLIDGILGTGFHGQVEGIFKIAIEKANDSQLPIVAIDIPSGIDGTTGKIGKIAISACATIFLGLPKTGCFFKEAWDYVGKIYLYDFGLGAIYIDAANEDYNLIDDFTIKNIFPKITRTRHKYQAGYVVGLGGSHGMPGAPIMASFAALRAGAGIVRLLHPKGMETELSFAPFEIIRQSYTEDDEENVLSTISHASSVFIGPGIGTSVSIATFLKKILSQIKKPCVIDAQALTLIAEQSIDLPNKTIMTPHHGEMKKLLNIQQDITFGELIEMAHNYSLNRKVTLVLKGAPTFIFHPNHKPYVCSRGDPGMATAGSGDVLTGIIATFLAQLQDPLKAAILGVQLHAIAGEYAAEKWTSYCMVATDIINALKQVYKCYSRFFSDFKPMQ